jgi:pyrroloquinoline quinone biosynthesis protein E
MVPRPYTLVAELTYACPLRCVYCSNPLELAGPGDRLSTAQWCEVIDGAARLGVLQVHFTGGEPLLRDDLELLVARARERELYINLITSGATLTRDRLAALAAAGVDNVQISIQDTTAEGAARIAGPPGAEYHDHKREVAGWVKQQGLALTINVVLHRLNLDRVSDMISYAAEVGADRLELANTQYHGWALRNRDHLVPTPAQLAAGAALADAAQQQFAGRMEILFVKPDYFGNYPRACMDGWARRFLVVTPSGQVLPCHAAHAITTLHFETIRDRPIDEIWVDSPALVAYRGEDWMQEPCASCEHRGRDFGGCRCQAFQLVGDAAATDPACVRSPAHELVVLARSKTTPPSEPLAYRKLTTIRAR